MPSPSYFSVASSVSSDWNRLVDLPALTAMQRFPRFCVVAGGYVQEDAVQTAPQWRRDSFRAFCQQFVFVEHGMCQGWGLGGGGA